MSRLRLYDIDTFPKFLGNVILLRHLTYTFSSMAILFAPLQVLPQCRAGLHLKPHNVFKDYRCGMRKMQPIYSFSRSLPPRGTSCAFRREPGSCFKDRPVGAHASRARITKAFFLHIVFACRCRFRARSTTAGFHRFSQAGWKQFA